MSYDDVHQTDIATLAEKNKWGLMKGPTPSRKNVEVRLSDTRGRSAFVKKLSTRRLCEYRGVVKPKQESLLDEKEYESMSWGATAHRQLK